MIDRHPGFTVAIAMALASQAFAAATQPAATLTNGIPTTAPATAPATQPATQPAARRFAPPVGNELADALKQAPPGHLIEGDAYYAFSATFFYTNQSALLWNGRSANLEYGSYAPGAKRVFIGDDVLKSRWTSAERTYLLVWGSDMQHLKQLLGDNLKVVATSGGNYLLVNQ